VEKKNYMARNEEGKYKKQENNSDDEESVRGGQIEET